MPTAAQSKHLTTLLGVPLQRTTEKDLIRRLLRESESGHGGWLCPVNVDVLRQIHRDPEIRELVSSADLLVADGMPLLWASRIAGAPLPERVAGSTLLTTLPREAAATTRASVFFLGGNEGTAARAAELLQDSTPELRIAGTLCPPFGFEKDPAAMKAIEDQLKESQPDFVFVGLGFPKQDRLIQQLRSVLPNAWFVSCGVSFSFVSGEITRAPKWMQKTGMEWLHRMVQEPRRLVRRYLIDGIPFLAYLFAVTARTRLRHVR